MSSRDFGLGPKWWQQPENKLQKCSERFTEWCDPTETDGCCAIIPCMYCLELEIYGEETQKSGTEFGTMGWVGSVGGGEFFGFWEVGYESGVCEFVVQWNGEEVYRKSCDDGQSCRDSSDEAAVVIDYKDATLRWIKHEYWPLPYERDEETGCTVHFCDDCECTCEELCVAVSEVLDFAYSEFRDTYDGEIANVAYPCLPPVWEGVVGSYDLSLALGSDEYGRCIISPTVNGVEQASVLAPGCTNLDSTITLEDGSTINVRCKKCDCAETIGNCICDRPIGKTLKMYFASSNAPAIVHEVTLTYGSILESGITCLPFSPGAFPGYSGDFDGILAIPMGGSRAETIEFRMMCECTNCSLCMYYRFGWDPDRTWRVTTIERTSCECPALLTVGDFAFNDVWSYQIFDITIVENESNC